MALSVLVAVATVLLPCVVLGYPGGAPVGQCLDMNPTGHGVSAETSPPPYTITASSTTYMAGKDIKVTVTSTSANTTQQFFLGILLQARSTSGTAALGVFTLEQAEDDLKTLKCSGTDGSAVTHKLPSRRKRHTSGLTENKSKTVTWTPPKDLEDDVVFLATIVYHKETFWRNVKSDVIKSATPSGGVRSTAVSHALVVVLVTLCYAVASLFSSP